MRSYRFININGAVVKEDDLEKYLEKIASNHIVRSKSSKQTYPIPRMIENYEAIKQVYDLLNIHLKLGIGIHPAGEWLLDNFYIIEEIVKSVQKELTLTKYKKFAGLQGNEYDGFARIFIIAAEIIAHTDNKIDLNSLEKFLRAYQVNKTLSMDEIWNIGLFLQIVIIEKIRHICEYIYVSQMQKYKVESIIERLIEKKNKSNQRFKRSFKLKNREIITQFPFIEYLSYSLKRYGKRAASYLKVLEETVEKTGTTVSNIIKKEHYNIAIQKVSMGNCITSMKEIQRINFLDIFEKINGVEEILKKDPAGIYNKMDFATKECYRNKIKEISKKTKTSEIYIARKILQLANQQKETRQAHIGYFLIDEGIRIVYKELSYKKKELRLKSKIKLYIFLIVVLTIIISLFQSLLIKKIINNNYILLFSFIFLIIPISELVIQFVNFSLGKIVKPKIIPKIDLFDGIDEENACMVVIPTIIKSKEKVIELFQKLEVYYLANKSKNIYFTLLGDCSESKNRIEPFDQEVVEEGINQTFLLNQKYNNNFPIFNFLYRSRTWNKNENSFLGWERKRGLLTQFNEYILKHEDNKFNSNTIEDYKKKNKGKIPKIKYIITLDSDTDLPLNSAFELVGAMAHILNKPVLNEKKTVVIKGHALIQPRVGVDLNISYKNLFTKIFAGSGGIDCYTNAIFDVYQDNFDEGIFTGKGIYDLEVFSKILKNAIPENTVLSHDLLEGCYLRCGLATDILLIDGYPSNYASFMNRLSRWTRGDWQIIKWLKNSTLNTISKYKIFDNLRRSMFEVFSIISIIYFVLLEILCNQNMKWNVGFIVFITCFPFFIEIIDQIILKKEGEKTQRTFTHKIRGIPGSIIRGIITIGCLPYKAYVCEMSKLKTLYRLFISRKHLLEWITSEEAEKTSKNSFLAYYKIMIPNIVLGASMLFCGIKYTNFFYYILGLLWICIPTIMCYISKEKNIKEAKEYLNNEEQEYLKDIANRTWMYFKDFLNEKNNYLIPDNYQEDRNPLIVSRTSSTNIGLSMLAVISGIDMGFIQKEDGIILLEKMIESINELQKWNGHLYNWYNTKTKEPLIPRYISTVDSGNFVGYLYVVKGFLNEEINNKNEEKKYNVIKSMLKKIEKMIDETDFSCLYSKERRLFSIGFNIEDNELTDSYYDLLASEARQASLIAIAKKDVPIKHWNSLNRTMTTLWGYKGLVSWSGTAFEYLMPNINMPKYNGSLLDESCKFAIKSQINYSKRLGIPWGISEAAFNAKDLYSNYQYKAFGIPWLGLKRGLADEMVVASYGSVLAIMERPNEVIKNLKILENQNMYNKYGFYESIDYTLSRSESENIGSPVKTYMAHHQGLILLSINNLFNTNILQKRFMENPEIKAISVLLQEKMPDKSIITKDNSEKPQKPRYKDYENYTTKIYNKVDERIIRGNVISNANYTVAINQKGEGVSKYKNYYINRYKKTDDYNQGIFFYLKSVQSGKIWSTNYNEKLYKADKYVVSFMPDKDEFERIDGNIKTKMNITVAPSDSVEIRRLEIENLGNTEEVLEITSYFEPILSSREKDYAHPSFNNLFLNFEYNEEIDSLVIKRNKRDEIEKDLYLVTTLSSDGEKIGDISYEIEKEKFIGRANFGIPKTIKDSIPLSKSIGLVTEPIVSMQRTIKIMPGEKTNIDLIISVENNKKDAIKNLKKYVGEQNIKRTFELSKARVEAECRYLGIKGKDIDIYQKILSYIIFDNPIKKVNTKKIPKQMYRQSDLWKFGVSGDIPIILVKIEDANDVFIVDQILKAYDFFKSKNIEVEIIILDEEKYSYEKYVKDAIETCILNNQIAYMKNVKGGIFILSKEELNKYDSHLIELISTITIDSHLGNMENGLHDLEEEYLENYINVWEDKRINVLEEDNYQDVDIVTNNEHLKFNNEYGGFLENGKEYWIRTNKNDRLPTVWANVLANKNFGTVITENMGGYTWYKNSRLNRITAWHNYANLDIPSEIIYLRDLNTGKCCSIGANPMPDNNNYNVIYGFGYAQFIHKSMGIYQEVTTFVPTEDSIKVNILKLKNETPNRKKLKIFFYIKPCMGEDELKSSGYIYVKYDMNGNMLNIQNLYSTEMNCSWCFISSSEKMKSYTGDKKFFFGSGGISNPDGIKKAYLNNESGFGLEPCAAMELEVELDSYSEKEISLCIGAAEKEIYIKDLAYKYSKITNCKLELQNVKKYWEEMLQKLQVKTPVDSINTILNGWGMYQNISSRIFGRSGYYQSGGAYGFRDQLQDALSLKYIDPEMLKNQIIKHSKHQFIEGDVEHWWHDETKRGIRTRFSDDLLWLVFAVIEYIEFTGDRTILDVETNYLKGDKLKENQNENYDKYIEEEVKESIFMHCIRAIDKSINFGENGLPKIGTGDWNDGFSQVGNKGKGESVWLGFFLYYILDRFSRIVKDCISKEKLIKYEEVKNKLKKALNTNGWDGRWFKRAYMDSGKALGSMENDECKIDSIAQSWSVISNAGDNDKKYICMQSLENHLLDKEIGIIKLLDPPFSKGKINPGYIKAYMPGVRENGGQYTHAAIWAIIAECMLGFSEKATDLYKMVNPIEHSKTKDAINKYKVEPYSIPADIYGSGNLAGRGGWTWYTGSSSWYYKAGIEYILGLKIKNGILKIEPCIPNDWNEYSIRYYYKSSLYDIYVKRENESETLKIKELIVDDIIIDEQNIKLLDDGKRHVIKISFF